MQALAAPVQAFSRSASHYLPNIAVRPGCANRSGATARPGANDKRGISRYFDFMRLTLIKDGERRLSRRQDLALLFPTVAEFL